MGCCGGKIKAGLGAQIVSAGKAAGRVARAVAQHRPVYLPDDQVAARLAVCRQCPEVVKYPPGDFMRCGRCGCGLNGQVRHKARLATETCDRWPP